MTTETTTLSLRIPVSLKAALERRAAEEGLSVNQLLVSAAAEKLSAMQPAAAFFAERKGRGNAGAAVKFLTRPGGEPPGPQDELTSPTDDRP